VANQWLLFVIIAIALPPNNLYTVIKLTAVLMKTISCTGFLVSLGMVGFRISIGGPFGLIPEVGLAGGGQFHYFWGICRVYRTGRQFCFGNFGRRRSNSGQSHYFGRSPKFGERPE
jgi:hypothetical protein